MNLSKSLNILKREKSRSNLHVYIDESEYDETERKFYSDLMLFPCYEGFEFIYKVDLEPFPRRESSSDSNFSTPFNPMRERERGKGKGREKESKRLYCFIERSKITNTWVGYVSIPKNLIYSTNNINIHGGLTITRISKNGQVMVGFECCQEEDFVPSFNTAGNKFWGCQDVINETIRLAEQILQL